MKGVPAPTDLTTLRYPLFASEKIDGWRCLVCDLEWARANIPIEPKHQHYFDSAQHTVALSASLKPISNHHVQRQLDHPGLVGCDGELIASERFNETSSAFASFGGEPAFAFHIFDLFDRPKESFDSRLLSLFLRKLPKIDDNTELRKHPQFEINSADHLTRFLEEKLPSDAEGAITRDPSGAYKFGRSTARQQWMLKIKPFVDAEAMVVGVEELMHNENDPEMSQLGLQKRSSHKDGKVPSGKLGALVCQQLVRDIYDPGGYASGVAFRIGTGFTEAERHMLWAQRKGLYGRIVKFKYIKKGSVDLPRHPVFLGFRAEDLG
jgi:DNA ligase-1